MIRSQRSSVLASPRSVGATVGALTSSSTGSPTSGSVDYGGYTYDYLKWTGDGLWTALTTGWVDVVVVGAGGPGNSGSAYGGGGGGVVSRRVYVTAGTTYATYVASAVAINAGVNGGYSSFGDIVALGGGYGSASGAGGPGSSGGGGDTTASSAIANGVQGYAGSTSGAGGGAGGAASGATPGVGLTTWAGTFGAGNYGSHHTPAANSGDGGNGTSGTSAAGVVYVGFRRN